MIKYLLAGVFLMLAVTEGISQKKIGDIEYIVVPTQFEFLKGKDTYRLNTFTRYTLRNYGFNAVFQEELPGDSKRCDVLWLDAEGRVGLPWTRITVNVKDCNGFIVFRTVEGKSKLKEYGASYREAMDKALVSFEFYDESAEATSVVAEESVSNSRTVAAATATAVVVDETIVTPEEEKLLSAAAESKQVYIFQDYKLITTEANFTVVRGGETIGKMIPTSQKNTYLVNTSEFSGIAYKTKNGFEIERQIDGQSELVVMKFVKYEE